MKASNFLNDPEFKKALATTIQGLEKMTNALPDLIEDMKKDMSKEDIEKVQKAMESGNYNGVMNDFRTAQKDFNSFMEEINDVGKD